MIWLVMRLLINCNDIYIVTSIPHNLLVFKKMYLKHLKNISKYETSQNSTIFWYKCAKIRCVV